MFKKFNIIYIIILIMNQQQMMNVMNMMNMQNNFNKPNTNIIFDPSKIDKHNRKLIINTTISKTKIGPYSTGKLIYFKPQFFSLIKDFTSPKVTNICKVSVVHQHSLEAVQYYCEKGLDLRQNTTGFTPVILNVVGNDFSGNLESSDDIRDDLIVFRTTFNNISATSSKSIFPLEKDQCVYAKIVYTIRTSGIGFYFLPYKDLCRYSMISIAPHKIENLLNNEEMFVEDYLKTMDHIELVFQAAIAGQNNVLILTPFGDNNDDNNPVEDVIKIYNYCIYKYGHYFKEIVIAIPAYYDTDIYDIYNKKIIRPQDLVTRVDDDYDKLKMKKQLEKTSSKKRVDSDEDDTEEPVMDPNQMQQMMKMMQNPMFMQMMQNMNKN